MSAAPLSAPPRGSWSLPFRQGLRRFQGSSNPWPSLPVDDGIISASLLTLQARTGPAESHVAGPSILFAQCWNNDGPYPPSAGRCRSVLGRLAPDFERSRRRRYWYDRKQSGATSWPRLPPRPRPWRSKPPLFGRSRPSPARRNRWPMSRACAAPPISRTISPERLESSKNVRRRIR